MRRGGSRSRRAGAASRRCRRRRAAWAASRSRAGVVGALVAADGEAVDGLQARLLVGVVEAGGERVAQRRRSPRGRACRARTSPSRGRRWPSSAESSISAARTSSPGAAAERERDRLADVRRPRARAGRAARPGRAARRGGRRRTRSPTGPRGRPRARPSRSARRPARSGSAGAAVAELAEHVGGELARRRLGLGAQLDHRVEHVLGPAGRERAHVRLPLVVAVGPLGPRPLEQLAQLAARQRRIEGGSSTRSGSGRPRSQSAAAIGRPPGGRTSVSSSAPPWQSSSSRLAARCRTHGAPRRCGRARCGARRRRGARGDARPGTCRRAAAAASRCAGAARGSCARPPPASASGPARARAAPILCA